MLVIADATHSLMTELAWKLKLLNHYVWFPITWHSYVETTRIDYSLQLTHVQSREIV